jgi:mitochondrial splicing suppressor protein 51
MADLQPVPEKTTHDPIPSTQCASCGKAEAPGISLKRCAKCQITKYCSRDCQKAHWKQHKKVCVQYTAAGAADAARISATSLPNSNSVPSTSNVQSDDPATSFSNAATTTALEKTIDRPFHALNSRTWLYNRPEADVYKLLIDTFRLRQEDEYMFKGDVEIGSVYDGGPSSEPGFVRLLKKIEDKKVELLPAWWDAAKKAECLAFGRRDGWSSLAKMVEKSDVVEHYADPLMPMQLRMFGEQVYGSGPNRQSGATMLPMQMMREGGGNGAGSGTVFSHFDISSSFR